jgi:hypothetical protein
MHGVHPQLVVATSLLVAGCLGSQQLELRGPLVRHASWLPTALTDCDTLEQSYTPPFHRSPYRHCRHDSASTRILIEIDAESTLTEIYEVWTVTAGTRTQRFEAEAERLTANLGQPLSCAPTKVWWRNRDSVTAALILRPTTDVASDFELVPWELIRTVRYGPLLDALTCPADTT